MQSIVIDTSQRVSPTAKDLAKNLDGEYLWPASMPCIIAGDKSIPIAYYGTSNAARMKTTYRRGLGNRYGRVMQVISGIHFNYSFSDEFWNSYIKFKNSKSLNKLGYALTKNKSL